MVSKKRAKATTSTTTLDGSDSGGNSAALQSFIPFQTGPSLERVPEDVLHEILSHIPVLDDGCTKGLKVIRRPVLCALSQTSRLLRSRCLATAWRNVEFHGSLIPFPNYTVVFFKVIVKATKTNIRVLSMCPHLWPLIQTVFVTLTRYQSSTIIPALADCLTKLPNLNAIQVVHAHSRMTTAIKRGLQGKRFPSVRKISLPSSAHEIIARCPNIEQVTCTEGNGSTIVGSLVNGNCHRVRVLKGISAPLKRLVKVIPNLRHISVEMGADMTQLASFPHLDTIEVSCYSKLNRSPSQIAASDVETAREILRKNTHVAERTVIVTKRNTWNSPRFEFDWDTTRECMIREAIRV